MNEKSGKRYIVRSFLCPISFIDVKSLVIAYKIISKKSCFETKFAFAMQQTLSMVVYHAGLL